MSHLKNPKEDFLNFCKELSNNSSLNYNEKVAQSEKKSGYRNSALCNFIKSFGNIKNDVDEVLDFYLDGDTPSYVDMPIWYTHNIKNIGDEILYTNFWINDIGPIR